MTTMRYLADLVDFGYFGVCEVWLSQYFGRLVNCISIRVGQIFEFRRLCNSATSNYTFKSMNLKLTIFSREMEYDFKRFLTPLLCLTTLSLKNDLEYVNSNRSYVSIQMDQKSESVVKIVTNFVFQKSGKFQQNFN